MIITRPTKRQPLGFAKENTPRFLAAHLPTPHGRHRAWEEVTDFVLKILLVIIMLFLTISLASTVFAGEYNPVRLGTVDSWYDSYNRVHAPTPGQSPTMMDIQDAARLEGFVLALVSQRVIKFNATIPKGTTLEEIVGQSGSNSSPSPPG